MDKVRLGTRHLDTLRRAAGATQRLNAAQRLLTEIEAGNIEINGGTSFADLRAVVDPLKTHAVLADAATRAMLKIEQLDPTPPPPPSGPAQYYLEELLALRAGIDPSDGSSVGAVVKAMGRDEIARRITDGEISWADIEQFLDSPDGTLRHGALKMIKTIKPPQIKGEEAIVFLGNLLRPEVDQKTKDIAANALEEGYNVPPMQAGATGPAPASAGAAAAAPLPPAPPAPSREQALSDRVDELTANLQNAERLLTEARNKSDHLARELEMTKNSCDRLKNLADRKNEQIEVLRKALTEGGEQEKRLNEQIDRLNTEKEEIARRSLAASAERVRIEQELYQAEQRIDQAAAVQKETARTLARAQECLRQAEADLAAARAQAATPEQELEQLSTELKAVAIAITDLDGRLSVLLSQKDTEVDQPLAAKSAERDSAQARLADLQRITSERENAFRTALEALSAREGTLRAEKEKLSSQSATIEPKYTETEQAEKIEAETLLLCLSSLSGNDSTKVALTQKVEQLRAAATTRTIQEATAQADADLAALAEERKQLTDRHLSSVMAGKSEYPELIRLEKTDLPALSAAIAELEGKLANLSQQIENVTGERSTLKGAAEEKVARVNEIKATLISGLEIAQRILLDHAAAAAEKTGG